MREKHSVSHSRNARSTVSVSQWEWNRCPSSSSSARISQMVVDLAVERDGGVAIVADDRLIAAGQIDDLQSDGAQSCFAALENPLLVRSAMV